MYKNKNSEYILAKCVLPFLLPDAVKLALATLLRARLYRRIPA